MRPWFCSCGDPRRLASFHNISRFMIPANHDSRIEAQQLPRERFSPLAELSHTRAIEPGEIFVTRYPRAAIASFSSFCVLSSKPDVLGGRCIILMTTPTTFSSSNEVRSIEVSGTKRFELRTEHAVLRTQCSTLAQQRRNSQQLGSVTGDTDEHENHISLAGVPAPLA